MKIQRPFNIFLIIMFFYGFYGVKNLYASQKLPVEGEITATQINPVDSVASIQLRILSHLDLKNVLIVLELPEGVETLDKNNLVFSGSFKKNEELIFNSNIKFYMNGLFKIGARIIIDNNPNRQSKLLMINIEKQNSTFNIIDLDKKVKEERLSDYILQKKTKEGERVGRAKKID